MTQETSAASIARIERALARIEAAAKRAPATTRDTRMRERVQEALASLDTVIARVAGNSNKGNN